MPSPFDWKSAPSVLAQDKAFKPLTSGKMRSQTAAEAVDRYIVENGRSPGSIDGLGGNPARPIRKVKPKGVPR